MMPEEAKDTQPLQTKPLAASLTPLAQRQAMPEEEKQAEPPVQKKPLAESITPLAPRHMIPEEEQRGAARANEIHAATSRRRGERGCRPRY